jgi:hypothetical protein
MGMGKGKREEGRGKREWEMGNGNLQTCESANLRTRKPANEPAYLRTCEPAYPRLLSCKMRGDSVHMPRIVSTL